MRNRRVLRTVSAPNKPRPGWRGKTSSGAKPRGLRSGNLLYARIEISISSRKNSREALHAAAVCVSVLNRILRMV